MTDGEDLAAWYRADRETARGVFSEMDSATLVAMLPVLDREIELAKAALAAWQRRHEQGLDSDAVLEQQQDEVMVALNARAVTDPGWRQMADEVARGLGEAIADLRAHVGEGHDRLVDLAFVQSLALAQRRHLLREELKRRGFLPGLP